MFTSVQLSRRDTKGGSLRLALCCVAHLRSRCSQSDLGLHGVDIATVPCPLHEEPPEDNGEEILARSVVRDEGHYEQPGLLRHSGRGCSLRGLEKAACMLDRCHDSLFSCTTFPRQYWKRLRTTNMLERITLELKRRTRKVSAFPG